MQKKLVLAKLRIMKKEDKTELIAVFKKGISETKAKTVLDQSGAVYRPGMDSSRGKIYFYKTGPKYILTFDNEHARKKFISGYKDRAEIYEVYVPDWSIQKD